MYTDVYLSLVMYPYVYLETLISISFHSGMCVCVCVCVCVKAMHFDIPEPIATKLYTHTKDLPGNVLKPRFDKLDLSEGPLLVAIISSWSTAPPWRLAPLLRTMVQ